MNIPPSWRLPDGVNASLWEYAHTPRLAAEEDDYFIGHPLFVADSHAIDDRFNTPGTLVDLGCGAGRLSIRNARRGYPVVAVDLSMAMLSHLIERAHEEELPIRAVRANLCDLRCFPDATFDYAISMFSTLGMIRGEASRHRALCEFRRILKPGGRLAFHVHNIWLNLGDKQGRRWLWSQCYKRLINAADAGDRRMNYRGIANMEVHLYFWGELKRELKAAGLTIDEVLPIDAVHARPIRWPRILHGFRAGGWIVFARRRDV